MTELWLYIIIALILFREDPLLGILSILLWIALKLITVQRKPKKKNKKKISKHYNQDIYHALDAARNTRFYTFY
ncbi:hypothetical protein LDVICp211 [lymphocystis disease virus-China]|uniref:Uncharacterized protein n=2 Tax=Lymphocystis disease virus 2 TaxID=159183 RepID=A0A6F8X2P7_9VIRU|nr:hypothetical protein LDVICp211 [lymphocystis disease virus-China]AAU11054.1 hypothetical protein [lymphocystis disease virus-China]BCB67536.1 hypothetical protein [Lymphocystis disease virus 2]